MVQRRRSHAAASSSRAARAAASLRPAGHQGQPGSLAALRKQLAAAKALQAARAAAAAATSTGKPGLEGPAASADAAASAEEAAAPSAAAASEATLGAGAEDAAAGVAEEAPGSPPDASAPIEWGRILTEEDFARIKELRHQCVCPSYASVACLPGNLNTVPCTQHCIIGPHTLESVTQASIPVGTLIRLAAFWSRSQFQCGSSDHLKLCSAAHHS